MKLNKPDTHLENITLLYHLCHGIDTLDNKFDSLSRIGRRGKIPFLADFNLKNLIFRNQQYRTQRIKRSNFE